MLSGSADGCGDGDDESSIEDWISAYLRDHLDTAGEWESCRDTLSWLCPSFLIWLHVVIVENGGQPGGTKPRGTDRRYETGSDQRTSRTNWPMFILRPDNSEKSNINW